MSITSYNYFVAFLPEILDRGFFLKELALITTRIAK